MSVLVGYASAFGSTQEIAERIALRLTEAGVDARALTIDDGLDPSAYSAVVLGSAIHNGRWLPEASTWARGNTAVLAAMPAWLFSISSVGDEESAFPPKLAAFMRHARKTPKEIVEIQGLLAAREHRNFAGVVRGDNWSRVGRWFMAAFRGRTGDHRNWPAIDAWALEIAAQLQPADTAKKST